MNLLAITSDQIGWWSRLAAGLLFLTVVLVGISRRLRRIRAQTRAKRG